LFVFLLDDDTQLFTVSVNRSCSSSSKDDDDDFPPKEEEEKASWFRFSAENAYSKTSSRVRLSSYGAFGFKYGI
tara:strand:- start:2764 stop:2985 length:222 start_codon:yes stop_codon:yes gene_type:complete